MEADASSRTMSAPELVRRVVRTVDVIGLWPGKPRVAATRPRALARNLAVAVLGISLVGCGAVPRKPSLDPSAALTVTQADNGRSVSMHVGQSLVLQLNNTYWTINGSSEPAVLAPQGAMQVVSSPGGCVPGQGCGTVTTHFTAIRTGHSAVTASRRICGEVLLCRPDQRMFSVTVQVS